MERKRVIRLIIEDREDVIYWDNDVDKPTLNELVVYVVDQYRKKYSTDTFSYRDFENNHYTLEQIAEYEISPVFLTIPHRKDVQTFIKVDPRTMKNVYIFKDGKSVRIQKFENLKRYEEVEMKVHVIRSVNEPNKNLKFEDPVLSADFSKMKIQVQAPQGDDEIDSPKFGSDDKTSSTSKGALKPDELLPQDLSKRKVHGGDGKSQSEFMKMTQMNKNPLGKTVELQMYTLEEIGKHKTASDCWMAINGKVYDVTKYIPFHPGGQKIMAGAGKDGTAAFNKYHPWVNAHFLLEKYHIGFLKK